MVWTRRSPLTVLLALLLIAAACSSDGGGGQSSSDGGGSGDGGGDQSSGSGPTPSDPFAPVEYNPGPSEVVVHAMPLDAGDVLIVDPVANLAEASAEGTQSRPRMAWTNTRFGVGVDADTYVRWLEQYQDRASCFGELIEDVNRWHYRAFFDSDVPSDLFARDGSTGSVPPGQYLDWGGHSGLLLAEQDSPSKILLRASTDGTYLLTIGRVGSAPREDETPVRLEFERRPAPEALPEVPTFEALDEVALFTDDLGPIRAQMEGLDVWVLNERCEFN